MLNLTQNCCCLFAYDIAQLYNCVSDFHVLCVISLYTSIVLHMPLYDEAFDHTNESAN